MKLKVFHNSVDYTLKMSDFNNTASSFNLSTHPLYVGFHKPLKSLYVEMTTRVATDTLALEYYNGSAFTAMSSVEDETLGLVNSGYITFPEDTDLLQEKTTIGGNELYWLKLTTTGAPASVSINGINLVLSSDDHLGFVPNFIDYLPMGKTSFIAFHQEARDLIVQGIRNSGKRITRSDEINGEQTLNPRQVDVFDLLDIEEFRNASKYLALSLIFDNLSTQADDRYATKAIGFNEKYLENLNSRLATIDDNDDGVTDYIEAAAVQFIRIHRE